MAHARGADFMFCDLCGTMMFLYSKEHVECPLCKFKKSAKGMARDHLFSSKQQQPAYMLNAFIDFIVLLVFGLYFHSFPSPLFLLIRTKNKISMHSWFLMFPNKRQNIPGQFLYKNPCFTDNNSEIDHHNASPTSTVTRQTHYVCTFS